MIELRSSDGEIFFVDENVCYQKEKMIELRSSDGEIFFVDENVAALSSTLNIEHDSTDNVVLPVPNVTGKTLAKVIEYCKSHVKPEGENDLKAFDAEFVKVDKDTLLDLVLAANYLGITGLVDLTCQTVADMIVDKSPEEVGTFFNIQNDYTPEEEEEVRKENAWAF